MRNSTLKAVTASFAAVAMIVSLGTSPVLARGGGGHFGGGGLHVGGGGHFGGGGFHVGGGFHRGGGFHGHSGFYGGYSACVPNPFYQSGNPLYYNPC
jgi:hypothetical protein